MMKFKKGEKTENPSGVGDIWASGLPNTICATTG